MIVPAGDHKIEFKFEPRSFYTGQNVSMAASLLVILLTLGALGYYAYTKRLSDEGAK
jgi:uncharacterized membrane protein YfhO